MTIIDKISEIGIVPVVKIEDASDAGELAKALCDGGIPCAEVTFRTEAAADAIKKMKQVCPDMIVGAGTVLTKEQVDAAVSAGAEFIVSPGFNEDVVKYCKQLNISDYPGCSSASDVEQALKYGLEVVKFFPAEDSGGLKAIKSLSAPYSNVKFMPTGGINESNICEYLAFDKIVACGGTWMVPAKLIQEKNFGQIKHLAEQAMRKMLGFKLAHIGINCGSATEAQATAEMFADLFGFEKNENSASIFSASYVESLKQPYLGKLGHIAIGVNSVERAKSYLTRKNVEFNEESVVYRKDGKIQAIYFKNEIMGYAIHLVRIAE